MPLHRATKSRHDSGHLADLGGSAQPDAPTKEEHVSALPTPDHSAAAGGLPTRNTHVESFAWTDLRVVVVDRKTRESKVLLSDVSGVVHAGQMMALMGPSGAGKTTLLNALAHRHAGSIGGRILVNGRELPLATHRVISTYVEQEDVLMGSLTTLETLRFAAELTISSSMSKQELKGRVQSLLREFGLQNQSNDLIGTPFRKGLSGGQKRRLSVASQLITAPSILFLDEPTSGLDSTASYEIMSYIKSIARQHNLIVIASIHQPSTKTYDLFDKITLLSQGKPCFVGPRTDVPNYFAELECEIPSLMNPAEHLLDLVNVDFSTRSSSNDYDFLTATLEKILSSWPSSVLANRLSNALSLLTPSPDAKSSGPIFSTSVPKPGYLKQTAVLLRRSWIKSHRDIVTYWVRVVMYLGLAILMGTVWLRLSDRQEDIQGFVNALFFGSAFLSFMAVAYVPAYLEDRSIFLKDRANGLYGPTVFLVSNFLIGLPYLFLITLLFSLPTYFLISFSTLSPSKFFYYILYLFLDLLAAESLVILIASAFPIFVAALAITAFANGLWMAVGGFLVPVPQLNVFWRYGWHYWDYQGWVFRGLMGNEFSGRVYECAPLSGQGNGAGCHCMFQSELQGQCRIAGEAVLRTYGMGQERRGMWVGIMLGIILGYRIAGWVVVWWRRT